MSMIYSEKACLSDGWVGIRAREGINFGNCEFRQKSETLVSTYTIICKIAHKVFPRGNYRSVYNSDSKYSKIPFCHKPRSCKQVIIAAMGPSLAFIL